MAITLNGTTGIGTPDITSTAAPALVGSNFTSLPAAQLTGALPAINGSSLTNVSATTIYDTGSFDIANSTQYVFAHGFGAVPDFCAVYLVCVNTQNSYQVGDVLQIAFQGNTDGDDEATGIRMDATNLTVRIGANGPCEYVKVNDFSVTPMGVFNFNMQIKAFKFA